LENRWGLPEWPSFKKGFSLEFPCVLQRENSYAWSHNKLLAKKAKKICVAYDGMEQFFQKKKLLKTGKSCNVVILVEK